MYNAKCLEGRPRTGGPEGASRRVFFECVISVTIMVLK